MRICAALNAGLVFCAALVGTAARCLVFALGHGIAVRAGGIRLRVVGLWQRTGAAGFHRGQTQEELSTLREQVAKLSVENVQLNKQVAQYERQIQMDQASVQETAKQTKNLNDENVRLQEDLAFFQNLTATRGKKASWLCTA